MRAVKRRFDISVSLVGLLGLASFAVVRSPRRAHGSEMRYRIDRPLNETIVVILIFSRLLFDLAIRITC
jgi:hypothetical protein